MDASTEKVVYEESLRAITQQLSAVNELRGRTGTLLATASIVTAFLGGLALTASTPPNSDRHETTTLHGFTWVPVCAFIASVVLCLAVLWSWWPWRWTFRHRADLLISKKLESSPPATLPELYRHLAKWNGIHHGRNKRRLAIMQLLFGGASVLVLVEMVSWLWLLGRR